MGWVRTLVEFLVLDLGPLLLALPLVMGLLFCIEKSVGWVEKRWQLEEKSLSWLDTTLGAVLGLSLL